MVYRFKLRYAPLSVLLPLVAAPLVAGSIVLTLEFSLVVGVFMLALSLWMGYQLVELVAQRFRSQVRITEELLSCTTATGDFTELAWSDVSHAGWYSVGTRDRYLFAYDSAHRRLLAIPSVLSRIDGVEKAIAARVALRNLSGEKEGLQAALDRETGAMPTHPEC